MSEMSSFNNLPIGEGWQVVVINNTGFIYPRGHYNTRQAEKRCVEDAIAGDADAITAILLCEHDEMLQVMVRRMRNE